MTAPVEPMLDDDLALMDALEDEAAPEEAAAEPRGPLLDEPDGKVVAKRVQALVDAQDGWHGYNCAIWARNRQWRKGKRGVRVVEDTDTNTFEVRLPPGHSQMSPAPNNVDKLIRRVVATLTVDPPKAEVAPQTGEDRDRDAAELMERLLEQGAEQDLRDLRVVADLAGTYASAFVHYYVQPQGQRVPVSVEAHPAATSLAAVDPMTGEPTSEVDPERALIDPATGTPALDGATVTKYVASDGVTLQDTPAGAQLRWEPTVCSEVISSKTVWFLPVTARGIEHTDGVVIGYVTTLGALEAQYPEIAEWDDKRRNALAGWRPKHAKRWLHPMMESAMQNAVKEGEPIRDGNGKLSPDTPVFCYRVYYRVHGLYPEGAVVLTSGDEMLYRDRWAREIDTPDGPVWTDLPIPVAQFRWRDDPNDQSPYGIAGAEEIGPGEEVKAAQIAALVEYLYRFNHPNVYLPAGTPVQPGALSRRDGTPIVVNMDGSGRPIYEELPRFPAEAMQMVAYLENEQNSAIGLEDAARGVASPSVGSGRHAQQIIEQALVALANQVQNLSDCYVRMCKVQVALWRAFYDAPRVLRVVAQGGAYKEKRWRGADLMSNADIRLMKGSLTMLSPERKQQMALQELEVSRAAGDPLAYPRYRELTNSAMSGMVGAQDDEQTMRVRRQLAAFWDGPSEQVQQAQQQYDAAAQQVGQQVGAQLQMAQQMGHPMPAGPNGQPIPPEQVIQQQVTQTLGPAPMQQAVQAVFAALPVDAEPAAAQVRWLELRNACAQVRLAAYPPVWQQGLFAAYEAARQAAGVMTIAEQQQAQQAAQQAEQQAEAAKVQAKAQADTQQKVQLKQLDASLDAQRAQQDSALTMQREAVQAAARGGSTMDMQPPA